MIDTRRDAPRSCPSRTFGEPDTGGGLADVEAVVLAVARQHRLVQLRVADLDRAAGPVEQDRQHGPQVHVAEIAHGQINLRACWRVASRARVDSAPWLALRPSAV